MSKAAENLQRRFGRNLSESLGVRTIEPAGSTSPADQFPGETVHQFPGETVQPVASPDDGRTRAREAGHMEIERIVPDPDQPRKEFSAEAIDRLARSLIKHGQLMPIRVRWNAELSKWVVISGERRYRAALRAGLKSVACIFTDGGLSPGEILQEQLIENCLREDLKPIEQARAYRHLMDTNGWTAKELSAELHISPAAISKALALLALPADLQEQVDAGQLPATAAYEVARLDDTTRREIVGQVVAGELTRDGAAAVARQSKRPGKNKGRGAASKRATITRTFKTSAGKVAITVPKKAARSEDLLSALAEATRQVQAAIEERGAAKQVA